MVLEGNRATGALACANRKILVKRLGALNRRSIAANHLVNVIGGAVGRDGALEGACRPWVVCAVGFDYV